MSDTKTIYSRRLTLFDDIMVVVGGIIGAGLILAGIPIYLYWKNQKEEPHEV